MNKGTTRISVFGAGRDQRYSRGDGAKSQGAGGDKGQRKPRGQTSGGRELTKSTLLIRRVSRTLKRGRVNRLSVCSVVGDGRGRVAVSKGASSEIQDAIRKAQSRAEARMQQYPMHNKTVPYDLDLKCGVVRIAIRRAPPGTGIVAGGVMRSIFEAAGYQDVVGKVVSGRNPINVARAVIAALNTLTTYKQVHARRFGEAAQDTTQRTNKTTRS